ncbi:hypothetical protein BDL97_04G088800 [Sphagnum fallax]|nr:hypothetical protein BDL97_04G088800 [Sphagnum fallax]
MLAARQSQGHELALEELNAGTRGTSNRDIFSADMVAATRKMAHSPRNRLLHSRQGAVYFVTHQKRRVSATCFKRLGSTT